MEVLHMKKLIVLLTTLGCFFIAKADTTDTWQILINNKVIFKGNGNEENAATVLKGSSIKSSDQVTIKYLTTNADDSWKRTFLLTDENDNTITSLTLNKQSGSACFPANKLIELKNKKQPAFIYTISTPKNAALAASVRVRRILLCKIEWSK